MGAFGSMAEILCATGCRWGWCFAMSGDGISDLSSGTISHSISVGRGSCSFPSIDSSMKLLARLPEVSVVPAQVLSVYGAGLALRSKRLKKSVFASDLLLCSSSTAYILTALSFLPAGSGRS